MIQLDARLAAIAAFVPPGTSFADIGGDHAYLAAALVRDGGAPRGVVGDLSAGACAAARRTVQAHVLADRIAVRQGDGLSVLVPGEAEAVVIAGMGGALIAQILGRNPDVLAHVKALVLQPMNGAARLRAWLYENGWHAADEALARAGGRIYEIIRAEPGRAEMPADVFLHVGENLIEKRDPLLAAFIAEKIAKLRRAAEGMAQSKEARTSRAYRAVTERIAALEELLKI
ncbi:class I SAM-dependent methyltransferase [Selenomonas sp. F0473]|uniref:tRNA (adenine(22)-N(1))-methyltransferase n=1 Tax=Selenomonas sp. F0473 TaxID=999423 RepID=UPI00029DD5B8|nr:class I SAM-dependent methyltransferase [Selenomonas sp. F0473]EKU70975.1 hypothetical protein HMPREF9161_01069 [Selenomonas sp. F0473]